MSKQTGWEIQNRTHFNDIVDEYQRVRPEWPRAVFGDIFAYCADMPGKRAVEIGAGTGKATFPFLDAGYCVTAIEVNARMAEYLAKRFSGRDNFDVIVSAFEDAVLEERAYDLIYAASAFHWVNADIGCPKAYRLLKDNGVFALFRYNEIAPERCELHDALNDIYKRHYYAYFNIPYNPPVRKTHADFCSPPEIFKGFRFRDMRAYGFRDAQMKFYDASVTYGADDYIAFLRTLADHRKMPEHARGAFHAEIKAAINAHGGSITQEYVFQLYIGRK